MNIRRNIVASYFGTAVSALAPILALPWYLAALGPERWGLVSFVSLLQATMGMMDAGLAQALTREFAVRIGGDRDAEGPAATLLYGFERIYWGLALGLALVVLLLTNVIATHWIKLGSLPSSAGTSAVFGAAAIFALQFPGSIYRSVLAGGQRQVALNTLTTVMLVVRHGVGAVVVSWWPSLSVYLAWNATAALLETLARASLAWRGLGGRHSRLRWRNDEMKTAIPFALRMSGVVTLGVLATQMDRIILSKILPIDQFGYYAIASTVAMGVMLLSTPIVQVAVPRIVHLRDQFDALLGFNRRVFLGLLIVVLAGASMYLLCGSQVLSLWLRNSRTVAAVYPTLSLLLVGSGLCALSEVGYANWVAKGSTRLILLRNVLALVFPVVFLTSLVHNYGLRGAAFSWIINNALVFVLSLRWLLPTQTWWHWLRVVRQ